MPEPETRGKALAVRLDLDPGPHGEVRLAAAREGLSMAEFARRAVVAAARAVNSAKNPQESAKRR